MRIISGAFGGRIIRTASGEGTRPAMGKTREALFSMLEARGIIWSGARVLDLFAGSGSLGLEALSRGARTATFVDNAQEACRVISANLDNLGLARQCDVIKADVRGFLRKGAIQPYNLVFLDPPYRKNFTEPSMRALVENGWLAENAFLSAEVEKEAEIIANERLAPQCDRLFGQTRIHIWKFA